MVKRKPIKKPKKRYSLSWILSWKVGDKSGEINQTSLQRDAWIKDTVLYLKWLAEIPGIKNPKIIEEEWHKNKITKYIMTFDSDLGSGQCDIICEVGWLTTKFKNRKYSRHGKTYRIEPTKDGFLAKRGNSVKMFSNERDAEKWLTELRNNWTSPREQLDTLKRFT